MESGKGKFLKRGRESGQTCVHENESSKHQGPTGLHGPSWGIWPYWALLTGHVVKFDSPALRSWLPTPAPWRRVSISKTREGRLWNFWPENPKNAWVSPEGPGPGAGRRGWPTKEEGGGENADWGSEDTGPSLLPTRATLQGPSLGLRQSSPPREGVQIACNQAEWVGKGGGWLGRWGFHLWLSLPTAAQSRNWKLASPLDWIPHSLSLLLLLLPAKPEPRPHP